MSDNRADMIIDLLRAIRGDTAALRADMGEVEERLGILESQHPSLSRRVDRIAGDVGQVKRRLCLVAA